MTHEMRWWMSTTFENQTSLAINRALRNLILLRKRMFIGDNTQAACLVERSLGRFATNVHAGNTNCTHTLDMLFKSAKGVVNYILIVSQFQDLVLVDDWIVREWWIWTQINPGNFRNREILWIEIAKNMLFCYSNLALKIICNGIYSKND